MIKVTRASSKKNEGLTIRTSQLNKKLKIKDGDQFVVLFDSGVSILFHSSRNGATLYANSSTPNANYFTPKVGSPILAPIKQIFRVTK